MNNSRSKKFRLMFSLVVFCILMFQGFKGYKELAAAADTQESGSESLLRWKSNYQAQAESEAKWNKNYHRQTGVKDIDSLFAVFALGEYGLHSDVDNLVLTKTEQVTVNDGSIGLSKICVASGTADGGSLVVSAPDYEKLLDGVTKLSNRPDVYIGSFVIEGDKAAPVAKLGDTCLLLRND